MTYCIMMLVNVNSYFHHFIYYKFQFNSYFSSSYFSSFWLIKEYEELVSRTKSEYEDKVLSREKDFEERMAALERDMKTRQELSDRWVIRYKYKYIVIVSFISYYVCIREYIFLPIS